MYSLDSGQLLEDDELQLIVSITAITPVYAYICM